MKFETSEKSIIGFAVGACLRRNTNSRFKDETPESKMINQHDV